VCGTCNLIKYTLKGVWIRNGGHICPNIHTEYSLLKASHGSEAALEILRFRLAHIKVLLDIAEKEGLLPASQARSVLGCDVYFHPDLLKQAKSELEEFIREAPGDLQELIKLSEDRETIRASDHRIYLTRVC
jgi:hypothetical protein